jgi:hypothetical protein
MFENISDYEKEVAKEIGTFSKDGIELYEKLYNADLSFLSVASEYLIKPVVLEHDSRQKSIDIALEILKFIIPFNFTLWLTSLSFTMLSHARIWLLISLIALVTILMYLIYMRFKLTDKYISVIRGVYRIFLDFYIDNSLEKVSKAQNVGILKQNIHKDKINKLFKSWQASIDKKYKPS